MRTQKVIRANYYNDEELVDIVELPTNDVRWPRETRRAIFEKAYVTSGAIRMEYSRAICWTL